MTDLHKKGIEAALNAHWIRPALMNDDLTLAMVAAMDRAISAYLAATDQVLMPRECTPQMEDVMRLGNANKPWSYANQYDAIVAKCARRSKND